MLPGSLALGSLDVKGRKGLLGCKGSALQSSGSLLKTLV